MCQRREAENPSSKRVGVIIAGRLACLEGFEPPTRGLEGRRSIQLSYRQPALVTIKLREPSSIGAPRFELGTPCAQGRCATRLRYAPTENAQAT